jgi:hypothetical protein
MERGAIAEEPHNLAAIVDPEGHSELGVGDINGGERVPVFQKAMRVVGNLM